ncbi:MAG: hypothetical protein HY658_12910, partial [Actinobacteria bacterium]|nr:hypothetical protein [Actinomycetota bacterium]
AAFQLADDLAGVLEGEGGEGTDLALERPNAVVAMARGMAPPAEARLLDELAARGQLDGAERERVREVVLSTGAVDRVRNLAGRLIDEAGRAIEAAELPGDVAGPLADLARQIGEGTR